RRSARCAAPGELGGEGSTDALGVAEAPDQGAGGRASGKLAQSVGGGPGPQTPPPLESPAAGAPEWKGVADHGQKRATDLRAQKCEKALRAQRPVAPRIEKNNWPFASLHGRPEQGKRGDIVA